MLLLFIVAIGFSGVASATEDVEVADIPTSSGTGGIEGSPHVHPSPEMPEQHPFYSDLLVVADDDSWKLYSEQPKNDQTNVIHYYAEVGNGSYPVYADTTGAQGTAFWYYDNDKDTPSYGSEVIDEFLAGDYDSAIFHFLVIQENTNDHNNLVGSPKIVLSHFVGSKLIEPPIPDPKPPENPPVPDPKPPVVPPVTPPVEDNEVPLKDLPTGGKATGIALAILGILVVGGYVAMKRNK